MDSATFAQEVLHLTNNFRAQNGLTPLTLNPKLTTTAQAYSQTMAEGDFFSHTGADGSLPWDRAERGGYIANAMGENIAAGQLTPTDVVQGWIESPGHRENLLNSSYTELGVGYYQLPTDTGQVNYNHYWTQLFGSGDLTPATPVAVPAPVPPAPVPEPLSSTVPVTAVPGEPPPPSFAAEVLRLTNDFRAQNGLPPLTMNGELLATAQKHSQAMADGDFFGHTGLHGSTPWDRAEDEGYTANAMAENIAAGQSTPEQVVQGWINSPGHQANMLNPDFTELGVGYVEVANDTGQVNHQRYWTQLFGSGDLTPPPAAPTDEVDASIFDTTPQVVASVSEPAPEPLPEDSPDLVSDFVGDANHNVLDGNSLNNLMIGLAGNDRIKALQGDDFISGGLGNDRLWGNLGNDLISGDEGNDLLKGGHGSDGLVGGTGNDVLVGGGRCFWKPEIDVLIGDGGADRFVLGDDGQAFYTNSGIEDYAVISDLNSAEGDVIQLYGQQTYSLGAAPAGAVDGKGLFMQKEGAQELIAIIQVDSNLSLNDGSFVFV